VNLTDFYTNHFIWSNPPDAGMELISRTVGIDRVVDEFIYTCSHDRVIDWLHVSLPLFPLCFFFISPISY
jgi:carboxymethylenebutenolidase